MCLGEICRVVSVSADTASAVTPTGAERHVSLMALSATVAAGDWLVVHSGFALERLTADEADAALAIRSGGIPTPQPQE